MDEIRFNCPHCATHLMATPPDMPGDDLPCPRCKRVLTIPMLSEKERPAEKAKPGLRLQSTAEQQQRELPSNFVACPACGAQMSTATTICTQCSYDKKLGRKLGGMKRTAVSREMTRDIRRSGIILCLIGGLQFAAAQTMGMLFDMLWTGVLVAVGVLCLVFQRRFMFIAIGASILMVGCLNIFTSGFLPIWLILGVAQLGWGIREILKFSKYR